MAKAFEACIRTTLECIQACLACENCCLDGGMKRGARLCHECAEVCALSLSFMIRGSEFAKEVCRLCEATCRACAEECRKYDDELCRACVRACEACAVECQKAAA